MVSKLGNVYGGFGEYVEMGKIKGYEYGGYLEHVVKYYNLTSLSFGYWFNQSIYALKDSFPNFASLSFGNYFNKSVGTLKGSFPNLTKLRVNGIITTI